MRRLMSFAAVASVALGCALLISPSIAEAHETRAIADGQYEIVIGFMDEPVFAGDKSGLEFWVADILTATPSAEGETEGSPVEGLAETLQAEVIFGDQTMALPLETAWDEPSGYGSVFFPMQPGDYTFRIYGTIGDADIDESFTSGPETFSVVQDPTPLQFPPAEVASTIAPVVGSAAVSDDWSGGGGSGGLLAGLGVVAGAAGTWLLFRRSGAGRVARPEPIRA